MSFKEKKASYQTGGGQAPSIRNFLNDDFDDDDDDDFDDDDFDDDDFDDDDDDDEDEDEDEDDDDDKNTPSAAPQLVEQKTVSTNQSKVAEKNEKAPTTSTQMQAKEDKKQVTTRESFHKPSFRVSCSLGHVHMSAEDVLNMGEGQILPFENRQQFVQIEVNGKTVGEGLLVNIKGRLGVKIVRWTSS